MTSLNPSNLSKYVCHTSLNPSPPLLTLSLSYLPLILPPKIPLCPPLFPPTLLTLPPSKSPIHKHPSIPPSLGLQEAHPKIMAPSATPSRNQVLVENLPSSIEMRMVRKA